MHKQQRKNLIRRKCLSPCRFRENLERVKTCSRAKVQVALGPSTDIIDFAATESTAIPFRLVLLGITNAYATVPHSQFFFSADSSPKASCKAMISCKPCKR